MTLIPDNAGGTTPGPDEETTPGPDEETTPGPDEETTPGPDGASPPGLASLSESEYHRLMAAGRRRRTLDALDDLGVPVALDSLAVAVAEREGDGALDRPTADAVAMELYHVHLPMMDELDVIDYDFEANRVRPRS